MGVLQQTAMNQRPCSELFVSNLPYLRTLHVEFHGREHILCVLLNHSSQKAH